MDISSMLSFYLVFAAIVFFDCRFLDFFSSVQCFNHGCTGALSFNDRGTTGEPNSSPPPHRKHLATAPEYFCVWKLQEKAKVIMRKMTATIHCSF